MDYGKAQFLSMRVRLFSLGVPLYALVGSFSLSPTFMLGIWHGGEWMKRDSTKPLYGWMEHGSPIPGLVFASLMKCYLSLYFY